MRQRHKNTGSTSASAWFAGQSFHQQSAARPTPRISGILRGHLQPLSLEEICERAGVELTSADMPLAELLAAAVKRAGVAVPTSSALDAGPAGGGL